MSSQFSRRTPTEIAYIERSVLIEKVKETWNSHIGTQEGQNIPIYIFNGFQQQDRKD